MSEVQTSLPIGSLLRERYLIKNVLSSSDASKIYLIVDHQVKSLKYNVFALKEIVGLDQQARRQFTFNGVALRQLQHPSLPRIHHVFNDDKHDRAYLVMDYIEGANLEKLRQQELIGLFPWLTLQQIFEPVCGALIYLHSLEKPLFHGDIKPVNIIQNIAGKIMLVDLGYAQAITPELLKQQTPGIFSSYHAPEYFMGNIGKASDIYGLGATLYTLLTGQVPISAPARMKSLTKKKPDPLLRPRDITESVPYYLSEAIHQALAINPDERFSSVKDFWHALNTPGKSPERTPGLVAAPPIASPLPAHKGAEGQALLEHPLPKNRRMPILLKVALLCTLLLLIIGAGTWTVLGQRKATPAAANTGFATTQPASYPSSTSQSNPGKYPHVVGSYAGTLAPLNSSGSIFTLSIQNQQGSQISGTFSSAQQEGTFVGTVNTSGMLRFTVLNDAGDAVLAFSGGFNGISDLLSSMGGTFFSCASARSATCVAGSGPSGTWSLNRQTTAHTSG